MQCYPPGESTFRQAQVKSFGRIDPIKMIDSLSNSDVALKVEVTALEIWQETLCIATNGGLVRTVDVESGSVRRPEV